MIRYSDLLDEQRAAVFLLHGVVHEPQRGIRNSIRKHIGLDEFERFLDDLLRVGRPVTIDDVATSTFLPPRAFAITFDDGFENNLSIAGPALEARSVPAAVYVTTGFVADGTSSWTDRIEYAFSVTDGVRLHLPVGARTAVSDDEKLALLAEIREHVKGAPDVDPNAFADDVCARLGIETMEPDPELDRKLAPDQVRQLARDDLWTVGGHGHTHRILGYLEPDELEHEIDTSLRLLERWTDGPVTHYSYPEGMPGSYSRTVIDALARRGIVASPTAESGTNPPGSDPFRLKRITVV